MAEKKPESVPLLVQIAKQDRINKQRAEAIKAGKYKEINAEQIREQQENESEDGEVEPETN